jgi:hypothetical protein
MSVDVDSTVTAATASFRRRLIEQLYGLPTALPEAQSRVTLPVSRW